MTYTAVLPWVYKPYRDAFMETCRLDVFEVDNSRRNLGIMRSHNLGIDRMREDGTEWLVVMSAALRFGPAGGLDLIDHLDHMTGHGVVEAAEVYGWHLIAFRRDIFDAIGKWDPNFSPYGFDDIDLSVRYRLAFREGRVLARVRGGDVAQLSEAAWWAGLRGDDIRLNTQGDPPYDAGRIADLIEMRLGNPATVLDLGCGTGRLTRVYQRQTQAKVTGFDPSPQILAAARKHAPEITFVDELPAGPFGGAYSVTVFQHLPHETCRRYVGDVMLRLNPGGRFVFQYVEGDEEAFLSHQATETQVRSWCAGRSVSVEPDPDLEQWRWVTVR